MKYKKMGKTGWDVSRVGFGCWAIGGTWGDVDDNASLEALHAALDRGVNFFDTADVYGEGRSERLLARLRKERHEPFYIATKAGRRLDPHTAEGYNKKNLTSFVERSLVNLRTDTIDLLQLHCPPTPVFYMPEVFDVLDGLVADGKIRHYGVSVEKVEEAMKAIEYPNVATVQIIYNMFRHRPEELLFPLAQRRGIGIIARVPLASGLLTGKFSNSSTFSRDDHRNFNRNGESFDKGETFSGVDFEKSLSAVEELRSICPRGMSLTQFAIRWILMSDAVTCTIPGAKTKTQVEENCAASEAPPLSDSAMSEVRSMYERFIKGDVHHRW